MVTKGTRKMVLQSLANGATVKAACAAAGIHRNTFYAWVADDPVFAEDVEEAKCRCVGSIMGALYRLAIGHVKLVRSGKQDKNGNPVGAAHEVYIPPSVPAANVLLSQLDPDFKPYNPAGPPGASDNETAQRLHELRQQYVAALSAATAVAPPTQEPTNAAPATPTAPDTRANVTPAATGSRAG